MKIKIVLLTTLAIPLMCDAQTKSHSDTTLIKVSDKFWAKAGAVYLDSVETDLTKVYLNPANVQEIRKIKSDDAKLYSTNEGVTFITRKRKDKLLSLGSLVRQLPYDSLRPFRFVIDEKLITDTTNVRIEPTIVKNIEILRNGKYKADHGYHRSIDVLLTTTLKH